MQAAPIPIQDPFCFHDAGLLKEPVTIDVPTRVIEKPKVTQTIPEIIPSPIPSPTPTPPPAPSILEDLSTVDRLLITKQLRVKNVLFLKGKKNTFVVRTPDRKILYSVEEENRWWVGYVLYGLRPMELKVTNQEGIEIMTVQRPYACTSRVLPCQLQKLKVFAPPGNVVGTVEQQWTPVKPLYHVKNRDGDNVFCINGPYITISCFSDVNFSITRADGTPVGGTRKRWLGLMHALFFSPVTDKFSVNFDVNLTVDEKALLLAATLLLDYMYYDA